MLEKLTPKQEKAFSYIRDHREKKGNSPTLREICRFMGYKSVGSAQDIVAVLRKKGYLETPKKQIARSFQPTLRGRFHGKLSQNRFKNPTKEEGIVSIPCLGSVPAGNPLEAIEHNDDVLCLSTNQFGNSKSIPSNLYALKAQGTSMINAGIQDGDWLVFASQKNADPGNIVVARFHNGEATIKRLLADRENGWFLKPENPEFSLIYAKDRPFEVVGKLLALQRIY